MFEPVLEKTYEEVEESIGGIKVKTIERIRKYFSPTIVRTEIQPILKIFEANGCYKIKFINEGGGLKVSTEILKVYLIADPTNHFPKIGYF